MLTTSDKEDSRELTPFAEAPFSIIDGDRGKQYPKKADLKPIGACLFLSASNVTKSGFRFEQCEFIDNERDALLRKGRLRREDIVLTTRGTLGNVAYFNDSVPFERMRINSSMVIFRCDKTRVLPAFLYCFLRSSSFLNQVEQLRSGAAQPQLPIRDINKIKMHLPRLEVQARIADILSAYDELIENNNRRMALLEEALQLLYREWFVYLRFPGHERVKIVDGMPEGWTLVTVGNFGRVVTGKTPPKKTEDNYGGEILFVKTPSMHGQVFVLETSDYLSERGADTQADKALPEGSIMVSCIGTVGVVSIALEGSYTNQQINSIVIERNFERYFCYFAMKELKARLEQLGSSGTTISIINKGKFSSELVKRPTDQLLMNFHTHAEPAFDQILILQKQNQRLREARDLLLPRLMNESIPV